MASLGNISLLGNKIAEDIPGINLVLKSLAKWDPSALTDLPERTMKIVINTSNEFAFQQYKAGKWTALGKFLHDTHTLDGYHASTSASANAIAVRNSNGDLLGNITGNAATATQANGLAPSYRVPINQGGTSATTTADARKNLGVPPISHAINANTYGLATDVNYGHVRSDGETTKIAAGEVVVKDVAISGNIGDLAHADRGAFGIAAGVPGGWTDFNRAVHPGMYHASIQQGCLHMPPGLAANDNLFVRVLGNWNSKTDFGSVRQFAFRNHTGINQAAQLFMRHVAGAGASNTTDWVRFITSALLSSHFIIDANTGVVTVRAYKGATASAAGVTGLVPAAAASYHTRFLRGDGTWQPISIPTIPSWKLLGSRGTPGEWVLSGLMAGSPILINVVNNANTASPSLSFGTGKKYNGYLNQYAMWHVSPATSNRINSNVVMIIPQATSITIYIASIQQITLYAYQYK